MRDMVHYENEYENMPFERYQVYYRRKNYLECVGKYSHNNILEVGCGLEPIFEHIDFFDKIVMIEPSVKFCENIYKKMEQSIHRKKLLCLNGFFEEKVAELSQCRYDFIIISALLHEVEHPEDFLADIKKLCDKDTVIHINVPNALSIHRVLAKEMNIIDDIFEKSGMQKKLQQRCIYSLDTLKDLVTKLGFTVLEEGSYFVKPFTHSQMQRCLDSDIFDAKLLDGLYNIISIMPEYGSEIYVNLKLKG